MTKYRVSEYASQVGLGQIEPRFFNTLDEVAGAILAHKKTNDAIHDRNRQFPASEKIATTGLDFAVMGMTGSRSLTPEEFQKLKVAYERAVDNDTVPAAPRPQASPRGMTPG